MARKPKKQTTEGEPLPPIVEEDAPVEKVDDAPSETIDEKSDTDIISINNVPGSETTTTYEFTPYQHNISYSMSAKYMSDEMEWALIEIERCNDYIFAKADLDKRFTVYRDELYTYRYNLRQLKFIKGYPLLDESKLPKRPDYVEDI